MFVFGEAQEMQAQQWTSRKIKLLTCLLSCLVSCASFSFTFRKLAEIGNRKFDWRSRINDLNRFPIDSRERCAQCFVPTHDLAQTPGERVDIQASLQMDRETIERRASLSF